MIKQVKDPIQRLGITNGLLYLLGRFLQKISVGHWRLIRYYIVAQPIPSPPAPSCRPSPESTVEEAFADNEVCASFPRPKEIIADRFRNGNTCLVAKVKGRFAGYFWYARNHYEEDEVRCHFVLADPVITVWDYDVHVEPEFRMGRTLARLWDNANQRFEKEQVLWSFSRISAFNSESLNAHKRLGTRRINTLSFLCLGQIQFAFGLPGRFVHCSGSVNGRPQLRLTPPDQLPSSTPDQPLAVVVGVCAHGLGMIRGLARAGIPVLALERDTTLPGNKTNCATIRHIPDINGLGLIASLKQLAVEIGTRQKPVLILTNDTMTKTIGENVTEISPYYHLSWAEAAPTVLHLLEKDHIEQRCREVGLNYPESVLLNQLEAIDQEIAALRFPIILKPTRPLSAFKTIVVNNAAELTDNLSLIGQCLPVLAQEFIPGDDSTIRFGALYLRQGKILARFEGRKLCSRPMGLTTVAVSEPDNQIHALALKFFAGLNLSGPASLELKQDPSGKYWVIEPTVGRTDFWEGLCSANGVSLPLAEYFSEIGNAPLLMHQKINTIWINSERHPSALFWLLRHEPSLFLRHKLRDVYFDLKDPQPFFVAMRRFLTALPGRIAGYIWRLAS